jgi:DoxX-like family
MESTIQAAPVSRASLWAGRIISWIVLLFLIFDGAAEVWKASPSVKGTMELGYSEALVPVIGSILLVCVLFYAIPQTQVLGAILITGYLGGAVASQVRVGKPLLSNELFPIYFGTLVWLALFLQDGRLRALVPFHSRKRAS